MALTATIYHFALQLNDSDRNVYEQAELRLACHPSETHEFMLTRLLAYGLEYEDGISFTEGLCSGDTCAVQVRDLTGQITHWIEIGAPPAERVHRGSKLAGRACIYTHRDPDKVLANLRDQRIHRAEAIPLVHFDAELIPAMAAHLARRNTLSMSVAGGQLYLEFNGQHFESAIRSQMLQVV